MIPWIRFPGLPSQCVQAPQSTVSVDPRSAPMGGHARPGHLCRSWAGLILWRSDQLHGTQAAGFGPSRSEVSGDGDSSHTGGVPRQGPITKGKLILAHPPWVYQKPSLGQGLGGDGARVVPQFSFLA